MEKMAGRLSDGRDIVYFDELGRTDPVPPDARG